ncbi:MAG: hypothetical protein ACLSAH_23525 [Bilophila wadsworthia]
MAMFTEGPHIYFSGSRIIKHWGDRYTFTGATTCDGPVHVVDECRAGRRGD